MQNPLNDVLGYALMAAIIGGLLWVFAKGVKALADLGNYFSPKKPTVRYSPPKIEEEKPKKKGIYLGE